MKFTIEISEEQIYDLIQTQLSGGSLSVGPILKQVIKKRLTELIKSDEFQQQIIQKVDVAAQHEINRAVKQKVPGWVKNQIRLMLKFARARFLSEEVQNADKQNS